MTRLLFLGLFLFLWSAGIFSLGFRLGLQYAARHRDRTADWARGKTPPSVVDDEILN